MKYVIDSSGWIHYFLNGPAVARYAKVIQKLGRIVTPAIVVYEVYKTIKHSSNESLASDAVEALQHTMIIPLDSHLACSAADISLDCRLSMADSIVYATARKYDIPLYTSDADFKNLPNIKYIPSEAD